MPIFRQSCFHGTGVETLVETLCFGGPTSSAAVHHHAAGTAGTNGGAKYPCGRTSSVMQLLQAIRNVAKPIEPAFPSRLDVFLRHLVDRDEAASLGFSSAKVFGVSS